MKMGNTMKIFAAVVLTLMVGIKIGELLTRQGYLGKRISESKAIDAHDVVVFR
jgi:hypothetical protein